MEDLTIAVVGAGSWGTALAAVTADKGVETVLWARREELAQAIASRHENPEYLAGVELPPSLQATHDLEKALSAASVVVMAVPSHSFRGIFRDVVPLLAPDVPVMSLTNGIEQNSLKRMSEVMRDEADLGPGRVAVLSGPNLAREVAARQPSATVVACADQEVAGKLQAAFMAHFFRVYTNPDVVGGGSGRRDEERRRRRRRDRGRDGVWRQLQGLPDHPGPGRDRPAGSGDGGQPSDFRGTAGMGDLVAT